MSVFTSFFDTILHLDKAIEQIDNELLVAEQNSELHLALVIKKSFCYAHVQLQKGLTLAEDAVSIAGKRGDTLSLGYALCCKALNQGRIGYMKEARENGNRALTLFESLEDEGAKCDANWLMGNMMEFVPSPDAQINIRKAGDGYLRSGEPTGILMARIQATTILIGQLKFKEALQKQQALFLELDSPNRHLLLSYLHMEFCRGFMLSNQVPLAISSMEAWKQLSIDSGNFHDYARSKTLLTDCYRMQKIDKTVMADCLECMECCEKLGCLEGVTTILLILANICYDQGQYADALKRYREADEIASPLSATFKHLYALNGIGLSLLKTGGLRQAQQILETALSEAIICNDPVHVSMGHRNLAEVALEQGQLDYAFRSLKSLCETVDKTALRTRDYGQYAQLLAKVDDTILKASGIEPVDRMKLRLQYLQTHLELAKSQESKRDETNAHSALADYYEETGDLKLSLKYHKEYQRFYEEMVNEQNAKTLTSMRIQYETEKKDREIALLKKEGEQAILAERLRISRDLHDDMGATLSSISVYSMAVKQRLESDRPGEARMMLDRISEEAQEMVNNMSDMVWMINPKNDSMAKLLERIRSSAEQLLFSRNISMQLYFAEELKTAELSIEARKSIYLIIKEAINNAAKYAACTEVKVEMKLNSDELHINVVDNGKGFDLSLEYKGNGLRNMKQRSETLMGELIIESFAGVGTSIQFNCRLPKIREVVQSA